MILALALGGAVLAADPAPTRQELWVPQDQLEPVLRAYPDAVLLTPEEYQRLIQDAAQTRPEEVEKGVERLPETVVVKSLNLSGRIEAGAETLELTGELVVEGLTEGWGSAEIEWPWRTAELRGEAEEPVLLSSGIARLPPPAATVQTRLLRVMVKGRGERRIQVRVPRRILLEDWKSGVQAVYLHACRWPVALELELPAGATLLNTPPAEMLTEATPDVPTRLRIHLGAATLNRAMTQPIVPSSGPPVLAGQMVSWRMAADGAERVDPVRVVQSLVEARVTRSGIECQQRERWQVSAVPGEEAGAKTRRIPLTLPQGPVQVTDVRGPAVRAWRVKEDSGLTVEWDVTVAQEEGIEIDLLRPLELGVEAKNVRLPEASLVSVRHRREAALTIDPGVVWLDTEQAQRIGENLLRYQAGVDEPGLRLRAAADRAEAQINTWATVAESAISLRREVRVTARDRLSRLHFSWPAAEQLVKMNLALTRQEGDRWELKEDGIELQWDPPLEPGEHGEWVIETQLPSTTDWMQSGAEEQAVLEALTLPSVQRQSGYLLLDYDEAWRVTARPQRGLDERDVRVVDLGGRQAWAAVAGSALDLTLTRAIPVVDVDMTAWALPLARTVEIEGQWALDIPGAPLRQLDCVLPPELAPRLQFLSPWIGERKLDRATGRWSLTFAKELRGTQVLRFRLSLPAEVGEDGLIRSQLPSLDVPGARQFRGTWVVEANTDTELRTEARGMQPVDALHVPLVEGYAPRHRVMAAFAYGSGPRELALTAQRHQPSGLAPVVVTQLDLASVLSADGAQVHEAVFTLKHTGEQFFDIQLPGDSTLLTTEVEGQAVKPVATQEGAVSLPLPPGSAERPCLTARILFRRQAPAWEGAGTAPLEPARPLGTVPVLETRWQIHAPSGYSYELPESVPLQRRSGLSQSQSLWQVLTPHARLVPMEEPCFPVDADEGAAAMVPSSAPVNASNTPLAQRMQEIILPKVEFSGTTIEEAVQTLRRDSIKADPAGIGIPIRIETGDTPIVASISLSLEDIPLQEALRYTTELAGMKYRIRDGAVIVVPVTDLSTEMYQRIYQVPPDFLARGGGARDEQPSGSGLIQRRSTFDLLKDQGIVFPEGASAVYNKVTNQLIVRNSQPNLDLVEAFVESLGGGASPASARRQLGSGLYTQVFRVPPDFMSIGGSSAGPRQQTGSGLHTQVFRVPADFMSIGGAGDGKISASSDPFADADVTKKPQPKGTNDRVREILEDQGIAFPEGSSVDFDPATGQLVVRSTAANLDLVEAFSNMFSGGKDATSRAKSGLLPLRLELPEQGQTLIFAGEVAPPVVPLRFAAWEYQIAAAMAWMALGLAGFYVIGRRHPWTVALGAVVLLTLVLPLFDPPSGVLYRANALVCGGLLALALRLLARGLRRLGGWVGAARPTPAPVREEVVA
ncbi:MAG: hypothetical protein KDK99_07195 [Verrucomicrobiales bacterium]|nr:hypothetical protein [Verrucomicrobiales bacterium]